MAGHGETGTQRGHRDAKTDIKHYPNSGIEGNKLARAPSFSGKVGANYRLLDHLEMAPITATTAVIIPLPTT